MAHESSVAERHRSKQKPATILSSLSEVQMQTKSSLLLDRSDVRKLLGLTECIDAVEMVFRRQGEGKIPSSGILGVRTQGGGLHVKTALTGAKNYIAVKLNTNFPQKI